MSMKNPLTTAGIEPATYRFVAKHLNQCATAFPPLNKFIFENPGITKPAIKQIYF
jgi:hypothetical protein